MSEDTKPCRIAAVHFDAWGEPGSGEAQLVLEGAKSDPPRLRLPVPNATDGSLDRLVMAIEKSWTKEKVIITYGPGPYPNSSLFDVLEIRPAAKAKPKKPKPKSKSKPKS